MCHPKYVSCFINGEFTAIFPAASSPAQCINPSVAEEEEAMTQEETRVSVKSVTENRIFYNSCNAFCRCDNIMTPYYQNVQYFRVFSLLD